MSIQRSSWESLASREPHLTVELPDTLFPERSYAARVVLGSFLGLDVTTEQSSRNSSRIRLCGEPGEIVLADRFFSEYCSCWLQATDDQWRRPANFIPRNSGLECRLTEEKVPVLFGNSDESCEWVRFENGHCLLNIDILGSAFFMLTRYEELTSQTKSSSQHPRAVQFGRFPARETYAYLGGFLNRPVVNEYVEILWACMQRLWPGLKRKVRNYQLKVSHDVDLPFSYSGLPIWMVARSIAGDLLSRRDLSLFCRRMMGALTTGERRLRLDPHYTFDYLIETAREFGLRDSFYFICARTADGVLDGNYSIEDEEIRRVIRTIASAGHEIGLHASFNSAEADSIAAEFQVLQKTCRDSGVVQDEWGGRHHYLRWSPSRGFCQWDDAGLAYDGSLGYVEERGFRCGTCYEYPTFSLIERRELKLREQPLIVMDASAYEDRSNGVTTNETLDNIVQMARHCRLFDGTFTLLWHNSCLRTRWERELYRGILAAAAG